VKVKTELAVGYAIQLIEPGDRNRYRRIKYIDPVAMRYSETLPGHH
jgi:hypothetical protein